MNASRIGSFGALVLAGAAAFALAQGCIITTDDGRGTVPPGFDSGPRPDSGTGSDGAAADGAADAGQDAAPADVCTTCQTKYCRAVGEACGTPLADKSNLVDDVALPKYDKISTYCFALVTERNACVSNPAIAGDAAKLKECIDIADATFTPGIAQANAVTKCASDNCKTECNL